MNGYEPVRVPRDVECPIEWCSGGWEEHGGEGQSPEAWFHSARTSHALPYDSSLYRTQFGTEPAEWTLCFEWEGSSLSIGRVTDLREMATRLRAIASSVDDVAVLDGQ